MSPPGGSLEPRRHVDAAETAAAGRQNVDAPLGGRRKAARGLDPFPGSKGGKARAAVRAIPLVAEHRILRELGLFFGAEMRLRDLVPLLKKNVPLLYEGIGGPESQAEYEKGLRDLAEKYGL